MSRRASQIIVLCEDKLHEVVTYRFLTKGWEVKPHVIRVVPYPEGQGAGEQHVREGFAEQLKAFRTRDARTATILIVVMDADEGSVQAHHEELDQAAREAGLKARGPGEAVVYVVPKWHMETWLAHLDGKDVVEDDKKEADRYKRDYELKKHGSGAHPLVDRLSQQCKTGMPLERPPDSLQLACREFERVRNLL